MRDVGKGAWQIEGRIHLLQGDYDNLIRDKLSAQLLTLQHVN